MHFTKFCKKSAGKWRISQDLFDIYQSSNYKKEILSQVNVEVINTKNLPFLGALKLIHQEQNEN